MSALSDVVKSFSQIFHFRRNSLLRVAVDFEYQTYTRAGQKDSLWLAIAVAAVNFALVIYLIWFLRKSKK